MNLDRCTYAVCTLAAAFATVALAQERAVGSALPPTARSPDVILGCCEMPVAAIKSTAFSGGRCARCAIPHRAFIAGPSGEERGGPAIEAVRPVQIEIVVGY
jgi:hypothetical protein